MLRMGLLFCCFVACCIMFHRVTLDELKGGCAIVVLWDGVRR